MNRPTRYIIVEDVTRHYLEIEVNKKIKEGWIPIGGPFVYSVRRCSDGEAISESIMQAMCAYNVLEPYITRIKEDGTRIQISEGKGAGEQTE